MLSADFEAYIEAPEEQTIHPVRIILILRTGVFCKQLTQRINVRF